MNHNVPIQMRFHDIDMLGHVNNAIYLQYFDLGKLQYITQVLGEEFDIHGQAMVIVNINCDFKQITRYDEPLQVSTSVDSIGEHSMVLLQEISNPASGQVKCTCRTVMVAFDVASASSLTIPPRWHQLISEFEGRQL